MSLFTAFGDESDGGDQTGPFVFGGFVAPTRDWVDYFTPAWEERVLNRAVDWLLPYDGNSEPALATEEWTDPRRRGAKDR